MTDFAIVRSLDEARAVLAATNIDRPVRIQSPQGAAGLHGIGWWLSLTRLLADEFPDRKIDAALHCGDSPGLALAALRAGVAVVRVSGLSPEIQIKLDDIARHMGARPTDRLSALGLEDAPGHRPAPQGAVTALGVFDRPV